MEPELIVHKETVTISGDRNLYLYTFEEKGKTLPPMSPEDIVPAPEAEPK